MSVCQPLSFLASKSSNITLERGLMVTGKLVPSGPKSIIYDMATIFPDNLNGAFYLMKLLASSNIKSEPSLFNKNEMTFTIGADSFASKFCADSTNDLDNVLNTHSEFQKSLNFVFEHAQRPLIDGGLPSGLNYKASEQYFNNVREETNVKSPDEILFLLYKICWSQNILWK